MNRRCASFLLGAGLWALAGTALAQDSSRVSLRWSAPNECPDDAQLVHQIEALLGQSLLDAQGQALSVRVSAQGNPERGYAGKVAFASARGNEERFLEHPSCDKLVEAMSLVIALAIDPERVHATQSAREAGAGAASGLERTPSPAVADQVAQAAAPPRVPEAAAASPRPVRPLRGLRVALHGLAGAGPLPGFGAGVQAAVGWRREWFRLELLGRYWAPRDEAISLTPAARLELTLATLGARACWSLPESDWRFAACGGADLGNESGRGIGVQNPRSRDALYCQLSGGFQVAYTRSRFVPEGGLEVSGALVRPRFGIREDGVGNQVFQPASWGFSAFLGFAFEL